MLTLFVVKQIVTFPYIYYIYFTLPFYVTTVSIVIYCPYGGIGRYEGLKIP